LLYGFREHKDEGNEDVPTSSGGQSRRQSKTLEDLKLGASASSLKSQHSTLSRQHSGEKSGGSIASGGGQRVPAIRCDSFSEDDDKFRLDADYIQRYLGELSPLEESQLIQLRTWVAHLQKGKVRCPIYAYLSPRG
jgi:hypothetical protein